MIHITDDVDRIISHLSISSLVGFDGQGTHPVHGTDHDNKNMNVDASYNRWYCYRHAAGGGPLQWLAVSEYNVQCDQAVDYVRDNFIQIVKRASEITGIPFKDLRKPEFKTVQNVFNLAQTYYTRQLEKHPKIQQVVTDTWGFDKQQMKQIGIGFAPNDYKLPVPAEKQDSKEITRKILLKSGLFYESLTPHIRGRITIPYMIQGQPRYFIGRRIEAVTQDNMGKYIKLLQYKKDDREYVSKQVKEPMLRSFSKYDKFEYVVITEGIADYYSLQLWGIPAITPVTTSFKDSHIKRMQHYIKKKQVYICNDSEDSGAGLEGALRICKNISHAKIVELLREEGQGKLDVNDYWRLNDKEDFISLLDSAVPAYHFLSQQHLIDIDIDEVERNQIIQLAVSHIMINVASKHPMYIIKAKLSDKGDQLLYYDNGRFLHDIRDQWLRKEISLYLEYNNLMRDDIKKTHITDIVDKVKLELLRRELIDIDSLPRFSIEDHKQLLINCINGVVCFDKMDDYDVFLLPHSPKYKFRTRVNVKFDSNFDFDSYHQNGLYPDTVRDIVAKNDEDELLYWMIEMAYLFVPSAFMQHLPHIIGIGDTGKSTIIRPIEDMFEKVSDVSLTLLIDNDYGTGNLYDIDLLSINEIDRNPQKGLEILKAVATMESLTLNPKFVSMIRNYDIKNKTIMRSNHYLDLQDSSEKRRFFLFRAHTKFDDAKIDMQRESKLFDEKDDIFNYIIRHIPELYKQGKEMKMMTVERYERHYKLYGDPLRTFMNLYMESKGSDDYSYTVEEIMDYYNVWAEIVGFDIIKSIRSFGKMLTKFAEEGINPLFDVSQKHTPRVNGQRKTAWKRIDFTKHFMDKYINSKLQEDMDGKPIVETDNTNATVNNLEDFL